jgi:hypothetical protein
MDVPFDIKPPSREERKENLILTWRAWRLGGLVFSALHAGEIEILPPL